MVNLGSIKTCCWLVSLLKMAIIGWLGTTMAMDKSHWLITLTMPMVNPWMNPLEAASWVGQIHAGVATDVWGEPTPMGWVASTKVFLADHGPSGYCLCLSDISGYLYDYVWSSDACIYDICICVCICINSSVYAHWISIVSLTLSPLRFARWWGFLQEFVSHGQRLQRTPDWLIAALSANRWFLVLCTCSPETRRLPCGFVGFWSLRSIYKWISFNFAQSAQSFQLPL